MKQAVIYARYSSDKQDEASIEAQSGLAGSMPLARAMSEVDDAAVKYLHKLLSPENQDKIAALRQYQAGEKNRVEDFNRAVQRRIQEKQGSMTPL